MINRHIDVLLVRNLRPTMPCHKVHAVAVSLVAHQRVCLCILYPCDGPGVRSHRHLHIFLWLYSWLYVVC